ncbi:unnamed protein product [Lepidochelys olivacea]
MYLLLAPRQPGNKEFNPGEQESHSLSLPLLALEAEGANAPACLALRCKRYCSFPMLELCSRDTVAWKWCGEDAVPKPEEEKLRGSGQESLITVLLDGLDRTET